MYNRYENLTPPPQRSKSSMCAPASAHRKLSPAVNRSNSLHVNRKKIFLLERHYGRLGPETVKLRSQKTEELMESGREEINRQEFEAAVSTFSIVISSDSNYIEGLYYRGMCYYKLSKYRSAIPDLLKVISNDPVFNKYAYYLLALCFEKVKDVVTAIRYISKGLYHYSKFFQGYLLRGSLYNSQQRYDKALSDFRKALTINLDDGSPLVGMAESLEKIGDFSTSYQVLTQAMTYPGTFFTALTKRAQLLANQKKFSQAISDFDHLLEQNPSSPEAYFYKAKTLIELGQDSDAVLCFEQAIKYDKDSSYMPESIFYLGLIKIKEKDFYGAIHQFNRITVNITQKQKLLRIYAEGVIYLIKRKFKEGISCFNKLIRKKNVFEDHLSSCYEYLGFAYCSLKLYIKALKYLKLSFNINKLSKASLYNLELINGYMSAEKKDYSLASSYFKKASNLFPNKPEPLILQISLILEEQSNIKGYSLDILQKCETMVEKACNLRKDSEISFYRGIILYFLLKFEQALEDAKNCIEKADENVPEQYIFRGLCYASLGNYQEAINDFSVALQLNESLDYVYDYRGRCAYLMDDSDLAYMDFQKLVSLNETSPKPYIQTAVVLMHSSSFSGAIASLENANSIEYTIEAGLLKAKAYILQYQMEQALNELNILLECQPGSMVIWRDREILDTVHRFSNESSKNFELAFKKIDKFSESFGEIFDRKMICWYKGVFLLYSEKFDEAIACFQRIIEILQQKNRKLSSDEALTLEEQNCEVLYNIALCNLSLNKAKALEIFNDLSKILNKKHKGQILLICSLIHLELEGQKEAEKVMEEAYKCDPETLSHYLNKQTVTLKPLNTTNPLAITFPILEPFSHNKVKLRPAICLPKPNIPPIEFSVEWKVADFYKTQSINPKPEPPWVKRNKGSIMFTENMVDLEHEPVSKAISKVELDPKPKKIAKSGLLLSRSNSEDKESSYLQSNDERSVADSESSFIPDIISRKIKEMCYKPYNKD